LEQSGLMHSLHHELVPVPQNLTNDLDERLAEENLDFDLDTGLLRLGDLLLEHFLLPVSDRAGQKQGRGIEAGMQQGYIGDYVDDLEPSAR
jgi:hypothetical protein